MEYLPLGNLADEHRDSPIAFEETLTILVRALQALVYLHSQAMVHRDIRPENILVSCRRPFLTIKLAGLGLAKDNSDGKSAFKP
jgi:serine/threonine protein kinase